MVLAPHHHNQIEWELLQRTGNTESLLKTEPNTTKQNYLLATSRSKEYNLRIMLTRDP